MGRKGEKSEEEEAVCRFDVYKGQPKTTAMKQRRSGHESAEKEKGNA